MNAIAEELRDIADKADAGDKPHWARAMRAGALQLSNWQRDIDRLRLPTDLQAELIWCRDEGNTGPRTHALLVELCARLTPNAKSEGAEPLLAKLPLD
jgi:hypothetical protein